MCGKGSVLSHVESGVPGGKVGVVVVAALVVVELYIQVCQLGVLDP